MKPAQPVPSRAAGHRSRVPTEEGALGDYIGNAELTSGSACAAAQVQRPPPAGASAVRARNASISAGASAYALPSRVLEAAKQSDQALAVTHQRRTGIARAYGRRDLERSPLDLLRVDVVHRRREVAYDPEGLGVEPAAPVAEHSPGGGLPSGAERQGLGLEPGCREQREVAVEIEADDYRRTGDAVDPGDPRSAPPETACATVRTRSFADCHA